MDLKFANIWLWKYLFLFPTFLYAAQPLSLRHITLLELQKIIPVTLNKTVTQSVSPSSEDLVVLQKHTDVMRIEHIRMQQRYAGFPIWGGYAVFHHPSGTSLRAITMNGIVYQKLHQDLGTCPINFFDQSQRILERYSQAFPSEYLTDKQIMPLIYIDNHHHAHWAYKVSVLIQPENGAPSRPTAIISANTQQIFLQWDDLTTVWQKVRGLGYGGNIRTGRHQFGKDLPFLNLIRDEQTGRCVLENNEVMVIDMGHRTQKQTTPMSFDCEEEHLQPEYWTGYTADGYDEINGSYSVSNDAMYLGELVKTMYKKEYGVDALRIGHRPMQLILRVHYSTHYANAFWDGRQMSFGDGDASLYALVSLGITAHEISHGFTQQHSGLLYHGQSGAINESFSDMAAQAAEYFVYGKASWQIGGDIMKRQGALRFLRQPSRDGYSIDRADQYRKDMDVHHSSGVYNRLFYLLVQRPGWNPHKAFQVMLKANMDYWTPTTTFVEGACGILAASRDLGF
ncbi:MAG TPA: M4 family metallopeptidase, partial [Legionellaceae bacterium]|nr:M4 family metallopeptidase [Legionellaceae bacterium]